MKIAVDVMGGDFAPQELVSGAKSYLQTGGEAGLILVGDEKVINELWPDRPEQVEIFHTDEVAGMGEHPLQALRKKKNATVAVCARLVKQGKADGFISAGSTGAQMAASLLELGKIPGIERPAISIMLPTAGESGALLLDVGANVDVRASHLLQFAMMGSAYYEKVCGVERPTVGLLNIGEEEAKGNELTKEAYALLKNSSLNFIGNIEPDHLYMGQAHVVVCDGFVGNILLKTTEGFSEIFQKAMFKAAASLGEEAVNQFKKAAKKYSPSTLEYCAAPLLGVNGVSLVCHGKSKAPIIANAITLAANCAKSNYVDSITKELTKTQE